MAPCRAKEQAPPSSLDAAALKAVDEAARAISGLPDIDHALQLIADDGVGFDLSGPVAGGHHGLRNMHKRAEAIGATLRVESAKREGTRIILMLPDRTDA